MPKLSLIAAEAERALGHLAEVKRLALQQALIDMCEAHWQEVRGPQPATPLAVVLWSVTPPLADLFADLYTAGDARLDDVLQKHRPGWGLALLVLAEISRGNAEGARAAHESMMAFELETVGTQLSARMAALLHGAAAPVHGHAQQSPLRKALALMATHTGRCDLQAVIEVMRLLTAPGISDPAVKELRTALDNLGLRIIEVDEAHVAFTQHGREHKPATFKDLGDMLQEIRQLRLG